MLLGSLIGLGPTVEMFKAVHPFIRIKERHRCEVVRDGTNFFAKENGNRRDGGLDIDAVPFELFDALG